MAPKKRIESSASRPPAPTSRDFSVPLAEGRPKRDIEKARYWVGKGGYSISHEPRSVAPEVIQAKPAKSAQVGRNGHAGPSNTRARSSPMVAPSKKKIVIRDSDDSSEEALGPDEIYAEDVPMLAMQEDAEDEEVEEEVVQDSDEEAEDEEDQGGDAAVDQDKECFGHGPGDEHEDQLKESESEDMPRPKKAKRKTTNPLKRTAPQLARQSLPAKRTTSGPSGKPLPVKRTNATAFNTKNGGEFGGGIAEKKVRTAGPASGAGTSKLNSKSIIQQQNPVAFVVATRPAAGIAPARKAPPKQPKASVDSRNRLLIRELGDEGDRWQVAYSIVLSYVLSENPFVDLKVERTVVQNAWDEAYNAERDGPNVPLTAGLSRLVRHFTTIRENAGKYRCKAGTIAAEHVEAAYALDSHPGEKRGEFVDYIQEKQRFLYRLCPSKGGYFKHPIIQRVLNQWLFKSAGARGRTLNCFKDTIPAVTVALICTGVFSALDKHHDHVVASGHAFSGDRYEKLYRKLLLELTDPQRADRFGEDYFQQLHEAANMRWGGRARQDGADDDDEGSDSSRASDSTTEDI